MNRNIEMNINKKSFNLVLVGTTGVGKSYLGNMVAGKTVFTDYASFFCCTADASSVTINWENQILTITDTIGFNNNKELTRTVIVKNTLNALNKFKEGINLILLCIDVNTRFNIQIFNDVELMFGKEAFKNTILVYTKLDKMSEDDRTKLKKNYLKEYKILEKNNPLLEMIDPQTQIMFSHSNSLDYEKEFITPIKNKIVNTQAYKHPLSGIDFNDINFDDHINCMLNPHYNKLIESEIKDLEVEIQSKKEDVNFYEAEYKNDPDNKEKLEDLNEAKIELVESNKDLKNLYHLKNMSIAYIELTMNNNVKHKLTLYLNSDNEHDDSLNNDLKKLINYWVAQNKSYYYEFYFTNDLIKYVSDKFPTILGNKLSKFINDECLLLYKKIAEISINYYKVTGISKIENFLMSTVTPFLFLSWTYDDTAKNIQKKILFIYRNETMNIVIDYIKSSIVTILRRNRILNS